MSNATQYPMIYVPPPPSPVLVPKQLKYFISLEGAIEDDQTLQRLIGESEKIAIRDNLHVQNNYNSHDLENEGMKSDGERISLHPRALRSVRYPRSFL